MISDNTEYNSKIIEALRFYHLEGKLDVKNELKGIKESTKGILEIDYGFNGKPFGAIQMMRGQFEVTKATKDGKFVEIKYNHTGTHMKMQDYINALKCSDLPGNQAMSSAIIMLSVECCRSTMVEAAMNKLMSGGSSFDEHVWGGLVHARSTYNHTAGSLNIPIKAGDKNWRPLETKDYIYYIKESKFSGNKEEVLKQIEAVGNYIDKN